MGVAHHKNEAGFSLMEILVVVAMLSVAAAGAASLGHYVSMISSGAEFTSEMHSSMDELSIALSDPTTCTLNLKGKKPAGKGFSMSTFYFPKKNSTTTLSTTPILPASLKSKVTGIQVTSNPSTDRIVNLQVTFEPKSQVLGSATRGRELPLQVELAATGEIVSCSAQASGGDRLSGCETSPWGSSPPNGAPSVTLPAPEGQVVSYKDNRYICVNRQWSSFSYVATVTTTSNNTVYSSGSSNSSSCSTSGGGSDHNTKPDAAP